MDGPVRLQVVDSEGAYSRLRVWFDCVVDLEPEDSTTVDEANHIGDCHVLVSVGTISASTEGGLTTLAWKRTLSPRRDV